MEFFILQEQEIKAVEKLVLVEWWDNHFYKIIQGEKSDLLPSATTKLQIVEKEFLGRWRGDLGNREADLRVFEAQERGKRIHYAFYILNMGGIILYSPWQRPLYTAEQIAKYQDEFNGLVCVIHHQDEMLDVYKLQRWLSIVKPVPVALEMIVHSLEFKEAGTIDALYDIKEGVYAVNGREPLYLPGGLYVTDLKTGKSLDDNGYLQTACYANCIREMGKGTPIGTILIHTHADKRTGIEGLATVCHTKDQLKQDFQDFRHAAALWERKNKNMKSKVIEFPPFLTLRKEVVNNGQVISGLQAG